MFIRRQVLEYLIPLGLQILRNTLTALKVCHTLASVVPLRFVFTYPVLRGMTSVSGSMSGHSLVRNLQIIALVVALLSESLSEW